MITLISFALALPVLFFGIKSLQHFNFVDHPNGRSSHTVPTTTSGGALFILLIIALWTITGANLDVQSLLVLSILTGIMYLLSLIDDTYSISPIIRVFVHLGCCAGLIHQFEMVGILPYIENPVAELIILTILLTWFCNLFNFIDGLDGLATAQAIAITLGLLLIGPFAGWSYNTPVMITLGVMLGFFLFNFPPARLFMGDVGSISLGFILGFFLLQLAKTGHLAAALIIPMYSVFDTTMVVLIRISRGFSPFAPHRTFSFHHAFDAGKSPTYIIAYTSILNLILIGLAYMSLTYPLVSFGAALCIVTYAWWNLRKTSDKVTT